MAIGADLEIELKPDGSATTDDLISLATWLRQERSLHGRVRQIRRMPSETELGGAFELISVAIGSGGLATVLAGSLSAWLQTRSKIRIRITRGERSVEIDASNLGNAQELLQRLVELSDDSASK
ncbi:effector-associated constant component EACC1 [Micromonospora sp. URMC 103]|uniref:effector-associated constant component EACC1 n=1 Tax=Micromonospora sp. URMC 103 TaxID=3423406 RepID=UPI003F1C226D